MRCPSPPGRERCPRRWRHPGRYRPGPGSHLACSQPCHRAQGTGRTSCPREGPGIVSQLAGATVLPRAVSRVAHDHADRLPEVNRARPGS